MHTELAELRAQVDGARFPALFIGTVGFVGVTGVAMALIPYLPGGPLAAGAGFLLFGPGLLLAAGLPTSRSLQRAWAMAGFWWWSLVLLILTLMTVFGAVVALRVLSP